MDEIMDAMNNLYLVLKNTDSRELSDLQVQMLYGIADFGSAKHRLGRLAEEYNDSIGSDDDFDPSNWGIVNKIAEKSDDKDGD